MLKRTVTVREKLRGKELDWEREGKWKPRRVRSVMDKEGQTGHLVD